MSISASFGGTRFQFQCLDVRVAVGSLDIYLVGHTVSKYKKLEVLFQCFFKCSICSAVDIYSPMLFQFLYLLFDIKIFHFQYLILFCSNIQFNAIFACVRLSVSMSFVLFAVAI